MKQQQIKSVRGFNDVLPKDTKNWQYTLGRLMEVLHNCNYSEIKTPLVEETALFKRSVGEATDIVEKEMFQLKSRSEDEDLVLRPENTASVMRALIENGMIYNQEHRLWYFGPMFRYERPQKGRYRQFHQLGVEVVGQRSPIVDADVILMTYEFWRKLAIQDYVKLEINTIGSSAERAAFGKAFVEYLTPFKAELDEDSQRRLTSNPMRILDSKDARTQEICTSGPKLEDFFSEETKAYYAEFKKYLTVLGIPFEENPKLVRGLDYYNDVVFEWTTDKLGAQSAVCGGGRYDTLVEKLGGHASPCFGFGIGFERLMLLLEACERMPETSESTYYIAMEEGQEELAMRVLRYTRRDAAYASSPVVCAPKAGSLKKQMQRANKQGYSNVIIVSNELAEQGKFAVRSMADGTQVEFDIAVLDN